MANYIITPHAEKDIDDILMFIAAENIDAAISFQMRLENLFELLADNPKIGRERNEIKLDLRSFPEGNYLIFYREWSGIVAIVRVLHSARDLDEIFG
ncbi:MAG: type II toxin-antitoxin system RelE/ParE family toxin [Pyrinomonadaceae bacterium]|nr:type II toxin-antitoxin system RelE/ParE family toxin [Pyrinomonadaceae bacterium]